MYIDIKDYFYMKVEGKNHHVFENGREWWALDYYIDKMDVVDIKGDHVICEKNSLFLMPPGIRTECSGLDGGEWSHVAITFYSDYEYMDRLAIPYMIPIKLKKRNEFEHLLFDMQNKAIINSPFQHETKNLYLQLVLIFIHDLIHDYKANYEVEMGNDLQMIRNIVMNSPGMPWTIEKMANMTHMSPRTFQRKYKEEFGKNVISDLYDFRLEKAKHLLDTGFSINHILNSCGFKSAQHFSRFFKERSGVTPSQYKKRNRDIDC